MRASLRSAGGRLGARRFLLSAPTMFYACVIASTALAHAQAQTPRVPRVSVEQAKGIYHVSAEFTVPEAPDVALRVLTDYEQIPRFMPDVKSSIVRERSGDCAIVEQEAVARMLMFSKQIFLRLEVRTLGDTVVFRDTSGRSFTTYTGAWLISRQKDQTTIRYDLRAAPTFDVPSFLLTRLLRRDATRMIERLAAEIARRARDAALRLPVT